jgi:hypothetical protein
LPSFYSERTAEYALTPKFLTLLEPLGQAVPIYFSGRREDTLVAFDSLFGESFHLVAFFARRPKINAPESLIIEGKINEKLFRVAKSASELGIQTICGISLANNIFSQSLAESLWFDISKLEFYEDVRFTCEITKELRLNKFHGRIKPTQHSKILSSIANSPTLDWAEVTSIMRRLPELANDSQPGQFMFLSQSWRFRPLYFVIRLK